MFSRTALQSRSSAIAGVRRAFSTKLLPKYGLAITRAVSPAFENAVTKYASREEGHSAIDLEEARKQHRNYVEGLNQLVPTITLPALDTFADSVFVEDTVVAIGNRALITNPGHPSRKGEVDTIRELLLRLGYEVHDMRDTPNAVLDGGDVIYTSRHLFVGLSARSNEEGVQVLADTFADVETVAVPFEDEALHLISAVSHLDPYTLCAPEGSFGDSLLEAMGAEERGYEAIRLPEMLSCNVVSVNGGILAQDNGCSETRARLAEAAAERNLDIEFVDATEMAKCDGSLTCCSVLLEVDAEKYESLAA